jgi:hypothetical protein
MKGKNQFDTGTGYSHIIGQLIIQYIAFLFREVLYMPLSILLVLGSEVIPAILDDTPQGQKLYDRLPIESDFATWGDEIYFSIPVTLSSDTMVETVALGDIAYWPPGKAFCIFYGRTPVSAPGEIRPASEVIHLGKVTGNPVVFKTLSRTADMIRIDRA